MLKGFKQFILRGNVVDLAVGLMMGAAFGGVVNSLVKDVLTPVIGAIAKIPDLSGWKVTVNGSVIMFGSLLNVLISFLLTAVAIYFFIVLPMNKLVARMRKQPPADPTTRKCPECKSEIPIDASRCAFCTTKII